MSLATPPERAPVLRFLRIGLHVMFALLLAVGLVRSLVSGEGLALHHRIVMVVLTAVLALVYVWGTSAEYRSHRESDGRNPADRAAAVSANGAAARGATGAGAKQAGPGARPGVVGLWLGVVTSVWVVLLVLSPAFVWLAFPLMFLFLHLLPTFFGVAAVALLWVASWLIPWLHPGQASGPLDVAQVVGPGIGAALAVLISWAYRRLTTEAQHHYRVAVALRATQDELASSVHRAGQLEERERLAREIHDTLAQGLSSLVLVSRAALGRDDLSAPAREALTTIEGTAAENLAEARRFVHHLNDHGDQPSLVATIGQLADRYRSEMTLREQPLHCEVRWEGDAPSGQLPEPVSAAVLRTIQVGLGNVAAHANAQHCVITVGSWDQEVTVDIFDDGVGFTPDDPPGPDPNLDPAAGTGWGLIGLRRRIAVLNGDVTIESGPGQGTVLAVRIPLTSRNAVRADDGEENHG